MGAAAHLPHEALLLYLAPELAQRLLELLRVLDDDLQPLFTLPLQANPIWPAGAGYEALSIPEVLSDRSWHVRYACAAVAEAPRIRTRHGELTLEDVASVLPGTGELMRSVSHCFTMSWHAATGGNWELAMYYLRRTRGVLRGLAVTRPKYREQVSEFDSEFMEPLYQALVARALPVARERFDAAVEQANRYHVTTGHEYIRWKMPAEPPEPGLDLSRD